MKTVQQQQQEQIQEEIPQELVEKFGDDRQLVQEFLEQGYSIEELQGSIITHPTKYDPLVTLDTGHVVGFWIERSEMNYQYDQRKYHTRRDRFF